MTPRPLRNLYRRIKVATTLNRFHLLPKDEVAYAEDLLYTYHRADFLSDPAFVKAWKRVREIGSGALSIEDSWRWRFRTLLWAASHAKLIGGDFVECGANTGANSGGVMEYIGFDNMHSSRFYLLDTFKGMDPLYSDEYEMRRHERLGYGEQVGLAERVRKTFGNMRNVKVIEGSIPDTLPQVDSKNIAYLSLDINSVVPEQESLKYFWPKMRSGGVIIFDDYGYPGMEPQKAADDKFAREHGVPILPLPTSQAVIIKP